MEHQYQSMFSTISIKLKHINSTNFSDYIFFGKNNSQVKIVRSPSIQFITRLLLRTKKNIIGEVGRDTLEMLSDSELEKIKWFYMLYLQLIRY